jgi:hypothetical protein
MQSNWTKRRKIIVTTAAIIALALAPSFVWLFMQAHEANKALADFSSALIAKDYSRAYKLTSSEFQAVMSETAFANQQAALRSTNGDLKEVKQGAFETEEHSDGWSSDISVRFVFARSDRLFDFKMKKQGAEWRVFGYSER